MKEPIVTRCEHCGMEIELSDEGFHDNQSNGEYVDNCPKCGHLVTFQKNIES